LTFGVRSVLVLFMIDDAADQERAREILGELAELGLMLARDLAVQARSPTRANVLLPQGEKGC
jgi:hypothetical protein